MTMTTHFNVPGKKRKELAHAIANCIGSTATYAGAPSFAYEIEYFTLDKDGNLEYDSMVERALILELQENLAAQGFEFDSTDDDREVESEDEDTACEVDSLTLSLPLDKVNVANLQNLLAAKGTLIKQALGISDVHFVVSENEISFPWFPGHLTPSDIRVYTNFIAALCEMSRTQKRISAVEKPTDNPKYAFRCFLLRLGFIGEEYKLERKTLLKNLSGNSAFKSGSKPDPKPLAPTEPQLAPPIPVNDDPFSLEEMLADEALIYAVNASFDEEV